MVGVVSGSFLAVRLDKSSATTTTYAADAQGAAEAGLAEVYATWDPTVESVMPIWAGTNTYRRLADTVRRINNELFLVRSYGVRRDAGGNTLAKLGVMQLFRVIKPTIGVNAAVTTMDPLKLNGNAFLISGINSIPPQ